MSKRRAERKGDKPAARGSQSAANAAGELAWAGDPEWALPARARAFRLEGRADALSEMVDLLVRLGRRDAIPPELAAWLKDALRDVQLEHDLLLEDLGLRG